MQKRTLTIPFPLQGIDRRWGREGQPNGTTPDALNVRTTDAIGDRERGGSRPGLEKAFDTQLPGPVFMLQTVRYIADEQNKSRLVAGSDGAVYMENDYGEMTLVASANLSRYNAIQAVEFQGKLYIANTGRSTSGDWVSPAVAGRVQVCIGNGGIADGRICYFASAGERAASEQVTARVALDSAPLVLDPVARTVTTLTASAGTVPDDCSIVAVHAGRLVLAGSASDPQQWFMSRVLDPEDWDYGADPDDAAKAVSGTTAEAGKLNGPITAIAQTTDLCLIFATRTSLHILRGDPYTGKMDVLSHEIGIIDKQAWCVTADGAMVFLSADGIYVMPAVCGVSKPESLSREKLPTELLDIDPTLYTVTLAYDVRDRGVQIEVSANDAELESQHWFLDWETKAFFRVTKTTDHDAYSLCHRRDITSSQSVVMLGCKDGYIRRYSHAVEDDDGEAFSSNVFLGPFTTGTGTDGVLSAITGKLADDSAPVLWSIHIGDSAESAYNAPASRQGVMNTGKKVWAHPRLRCNTFFVKLQPQTTGNAWAVENIEIEILESSCGWCNKA